MRSLVVGYGSIGARHARLLSELESDTAVLSARDVDFPVVYHDIAQALSKHAPDYVVIANQTNRHHDTLRTLAESGFAGDVLIEKPLFDKPQPLPVARFRRAAVAYNLRFHPLIQRMRTLLEGQTALSVHAYVGQYLPDWRPDSDYRDSYSASRAQGGGVLRDLSHELDFLSWLFGEWQAVTAIGGHVSPLEIDSDDLFVLLIQTRHCPALSVQMSYLDRKATRRIIVNTASTTIEADLIGGTISVNGLSETVAVERDHSYREMHQAYLNGDVSSLCSLAEALDTLDLIAAAERVSQKKEWITR